VGALTVDRKPFTVANPLVAADLHLPLDVLGDVTAEIALDLEVGVDTGPQAGDLLVGQVTDPGVGTDPGLGAGLLCPGLADAVDIGQRDLETLLARDVDAGNSGHVLTLPLLVSRVGADHHHAAVPANDLALLAHRLDARSNLHCLMLHSTGSALPTRSRLGNACCPAPTTFRLLPGLAAAGTSVHL
jgi:hypothetical protein